jgi:cellulose synthase/poly-beta-1,6-N-acetylglucosamine synthase-like glycosyltransferase
MISVPALVVFWLSVAFIGWAYFGFPALLALRALLRREHTPSSSALPHVSYVIVVHNERAVIDEKLANVEATRYPRERLQVIVASDGSDDGTNERVACHAGATPVELIALPRVGKNAALNEGVGRAKGEVIVFSDADSMLQPDALERLVAPFADPEVGGVGGDYRYETDVPEGEGERTYWSMDRVWKRLESRGGSMTSATGQIYAIRSEHFEPVPDGVTDDFFVSTGAIVAGRRLHFEPAALAYGPVADSAGAEFRRKVRMMGRGFASLWRRRELLNPARHGFYSLQLFSHKVMRRLVGLPVLAILLTTPWLVDGPPLYQLVIALQLGVHGLALAGWLLRDTARGQSRLFALPLFFDSVNIAGLIAFSNFVRGRQPAGWTPHRPASAMTAGSLPGPSSTEGR